MPGPCNKQRVRGSDTGTTDKKARKRLQRRLAAFKEPGTVERSNGLWTHKPGSEKK